MTTISEQSVLVYSTDWIDEYEYERPSQRYLRWIEIYGYDEDYAEANEDELGEEEERRDLLARWFIEL